MHSIIRAQAFTALRHMHAASLATADRQARFVFVLEALVAALQYSKEK